MAQVTTTPVALIPLFDSKRRKQKRRAQARAQERIQDQLREKAAIAAEEEAKFETFEYLDGFLNTSEWNEQRERISISWDALPTLQELESFGHLNESEGTQACRRLFKAVVVWDEVGHSLWQRLRDNIREGEENTSPAESSGTADSVVEEFIPDSRPFAWPVTPRLRRGGSKSSKSSCKSTESNRSPRTSIDRHDRQTASAGPELSRRSSLPWSPSPLVERWRASTSGRRSTEPPLSSKETDHMISKASDDSRYTLPRLVSQNCANAVRRTLSVFGESRSNRTPGRGSV